MTSRKKLYSVELANLKAEAEHLPNGIKIDPEGNAYVTDSFAPVIYKIDLEGNASVFLESDRFKGDGINLNGIVYHPDGYFLAVKKSDGILFKIPVKNPGSFTEVKTDSKFLGGDGLLLINKNELVLAANIVPASATEAIFSVQTNDNWESAEVRESYKIGGVYPTTVELKGDKIYLLHSSLNVLNSSPRAEQSKLNKQATIQQVGVLKR